MKIAHDELLAQMPEGASHDDADCLFCIDTASLGELESPPREVRMTAIYSEEDLAAKLADAVAPLQAQIDELTASQAAAEADERVTALEAAKNAEIAELNAKLDSAVLEAEAAKQETASILDYFNELHAAAEAEAETARLRDERLAIVAEVASFPDAYVTDNADRWAAMPAESFEALVNDWKAIAPAKAASEDLTEIPDVTVAVSSRDESLGSTSPLSTVFDLTLQGVDLSSL